MASCARNAMTTGPSPGPGCPVEESFDPLSPEFLADPYTVMAALPEAARTRLLSPRRSATYVVTSYDAVEAVFRDPAYLLRGGGPGAAGRRSSPRRSRSCSRGGHKPQPSMVSLDEPRNTPGSAKPGRPGVSA